jgi:hypothetical protein
LSKNTRWALAIVGAAIIIIGAFVIGTGGDDTDAVQEPSPAPTVETGPSTPTPAPPQTGSTGSGGDDNSSGGSGTDDGGNSGGASPDESGNSGGSSPDIEKSEDSGGAKAQTGVVSPVLVNGKVQTVVVDKGETVVLRARSASGGEMHVHGYDKEVTLTPGELARLKFKATIDGAFPIEFHLSNGGHVDVGTLRVNP